MEALWKWLAEDGLRLLGDIIIPVAAILVPTLIALGLSRRDRRNALETARQERAEAAENDRRSRRLDAGAGVLTSAAALISVNPFTTDMQSLLAELRGRIAVYRAWTTADDLSGDWLGMKHQQGMRLWLAAMQEAYSAGGPDKLSVSEVEAILDPPRRWAAGLIDTFTAWLSGHKSTEDLRAEGARLIEDLGIQADGAPSSTGK